MANYTSTGTVFKVHDTETVGANNFQKRVLWLKTDEEYSQTVSIEFSGQNIDLLDDLKPFDRVEVGWSLNGRFVEAKGEKKENVYNSVRGFKIKKLS